MGVSKKIDEPMMLSHFVLGEVLLAPLVIREAYFASSGSSSRSEPDALLRLELPEPTASFWFAVESKSRSTPQSIQAAIAMARRFCSAERHPLIQVPYLSPERLDQLESEGMSGVDLCGNGVVIVPGRLWIKRSGQPNLYRDSRPLNDPYRGRSAMVARMLVMQRQWKSLGDLATAIQDAGTSLSVSQVSKAVQALAEELVVLKDRGTITLTEPLQVLDQLARAWKRPIIVNRLFLRLDSRNDWQMQLSANNQLRWCVTGESSIARYATFAQGGPRRIAVSDLSLAQSSLRGKPEPVPSFADVELVESSEEGFYFANEIDEGKIRWASFLQTWLEAQGGDARQRETASDLRRRILQGLQP